MKVDLKRYVDKINAGLLTDNVIEDVLKEVYQLGYDHSKFETLQETTSQLKKVFGLGGKK